MLFFFYSGRYPVTDITKIGVGQFSSIKDSYAGKDVLVNAAMHSLAVKYSAPMLSNTASSAFLRTHERDLLRGCDWPQMISCVYNSTPDNVRMLRDHVVAAIQYANIARLLAKDGQQIFDQKVLEQVLKETPDLCYDLATSMVTGDSCVCNTCDRSDWLLRCGCHSVLTCGTCDE